MRRSRHQPLPLLAAAAIIPLLAALLGAPPALRAAALLAASPAAAPAAPPPAQPVPAGGMQEGFAAMQANDLPRAERAFRSVVDREPGNAEAWFRLGVVERLEGQYDAALKSVGTALDKGYPPAISNTSLALVYIAKKDFDRAFEHLGTAVKLGLQPTTLQTIPGFAAIRDDPRFKALLAAAEKAAHPCESDARYRAFDFWAGDWDVYARGQLVGANHIDHISQGCALLENWTGAGGGGGKSLNYFDPADGKWRQSWVGSGGEIILYAGDWKDGAMRMAGQTRLPNGTQEAARGTWTPRPDGSIHQLLETSRDGGKTWTTGFDAIYVKKGSGPPAAQ